MQLLQSEAVRKAEYIRSGCVYRWREEGTERRYYSLTKNAACKHREIFSFLNKNTTTVTTLPPPTWKAQLHLGPDAQPTWMRCLHNAKLEAQTNGCSCPGAEGICSLTWGLAQQIPIGEPERVITHLNILAAQGGRETQMEVRVAMFPCSSISPSPVLGAPGVPTWMLQLPIREKG